MRIDKFLKVSRIIKRRTVANEACDGGRVSINGADRQKPVRTSIRGMWWKYLLPEVKRNLKS